MSDMIDAIEDPDVVKALNIYFVSVDPERDTAEILAGYVTYFNPDFTGATAEIEKLTPLTRSIGIAHQIRNKTDDKPEYDVDHSSAIVLINPQAEFAGLFSAPQDALVMARDITRIIEHN
jgi:protein SCO1/2